MKKSETFCLCLLTGAFCLFAGMLTAFAVHDMRPMNYFDGQVLINLIGSLEEDDQAEMVARLMDAFGTNGSISQYEFDRMFRDAGRLKYGPYNGGVL